MHQIHHDQETVVKLHTRWHLTPVRLHRMFPGEQDTCVRGCPDKGTHLHTFWECSVAQLLWQKAALRITSIMGCPFTSTIPICLFFMDIPGALPPCQKLIHTLFSAIHWSIALNWKSASVPWAQVLPRTEAIKLMERIHHTVMDPMHIYQKKWLFWSMEWI